MEPFWEPYINAVIKELEQKSQIVAHRHVMSLFIGGGTPSLLPYDAVLRIMDAVRKHYRLLPDAEITIETNPGTLDHDKIRAYREAGINRLSIGLRPGRIIFWNLWAGFIMPGISMKLSLWLKTMVFLILMPI